MIYQAKSINRQKKTSYHTNSYKIVLLMYFMYSICQTVQKKMRKLSTVPEMIQRCGSIECDACDSLSHATSAENCICC